MPKTKLFRVTTVPGSLGLLKGQLRFMSNYFEVVAISSPNPKERLQRVGEEENVPVIEVEMTRKITLLKDIKAVLSLYKIFKKEKPFIVHTHTPKAGTLGMLAAKLTGVPHRLHTIAGLPLLEAKGFKRNVLNFVEKITYACATKIYPNSFELKNIIIENKFCRPSKLKVIANGSSNGIDTSYFNPLLFSEEQKTRLRESLNIKPDDFVFIFVGRLVKDKGINELVSAFCRLEEQYPQAKLLLVGSYESNLDPLLPKTLANIRDKKNIISVGFQKDVRLYFAISDALAFPSYREGFPNVVMQAGAMELPAIVTDINGCNEIVEDGINGLIIQPKDTMALKTAMELLLHDMEFRRKLRSNAREMITSCYEQKIVWNALLKEYNELKAKKSSL